MISATVLALVAISGCTMEDQLRRLDHADTFYQREFRQVDVLWVVDDSPSMAQEQALLAAGFADFILQMEDYGTEFHIGVTTTSFDDDDDDRGVLIGEPSYLTPEDDYVRLFRSRVEVGVDGSDQEKGLAAAEYALSPALSATENAGFRRDGAKLAVFFVSDENDCSDDGLLAGLDGESCYDRASQLVPVADYLQFFRNQVRVEADFLSGAIVGPVASEGCEQAKPGHRYMELVAQTGGRLGSICEPDFAEVLMDMGAEVAGLRSSFYLSYTAIESTLVVFVDDELVASDATNGWLYDSDSGYLTFHGDSIPPSGSQIDVGYDLASGG